MQGLCVKDCKASALVCGKGNTCATFGNNKYCVESCEYGNPQLPDSAVVDLPDDKCHGRLDLSCSPLGSSTAGVCVPRCWPDQDGVSADQLCPSGTACDPIKGVCVTDLPPSLLPTGAACSPTSKTRQCVGLCVALDDQNQTGICSEPCTGGVPQSCGGLDNGICFLDTNGVTKNGVFTLFGPLDLAGCAAASPSPTADDSCLWQSGWFPVSFTFPGDVVRSYCLPVAECKTTADCSESCKVKEDCSHTDAACVDGQCTVTDTCETVEDHKYCLDHTPTVPLPYRESGRERPGRGSGTTTALWLAPSHLDGSALGRRLRRMPSLGILRAKKSGGSPANPQLGFAFFVFGPLFLPPSTWIFLTKNRLSAASIAQRSSR